MTFHKLEQWLIKTRYISAYQAIFKSIQIDTEDQNHYKFSKIGVRELKFSNRNLKNATELHVQIFRS